MLSVFTASRFELLEQHLLEGLMQSGADPFQADTVVVPNAAVRRRLALTAADRHGICAQVEFAFLAQWLWRQIGRVLPGVPADSPYDPALLRWRIEACLADGAWQGSHPRLAGWLAQADAVMRFDLADRLAGLFDRYLTWRPEWLEAWSAGTLRATREDEGAARADERWQAALWRRVQAPLAGREGAAAVHPARAVLERLAALPAGSARALGLPDRVHVFCLPSLPPVYLDLLCGLSHHLDIALYTLNPCPEWWTDLVSRRDLARKERAGDAQLLEFRHRWLPAWARQTQATLELLFGYDEAHQDTHDLEEGLEVPAVDAAGSLLACLQAGVRALADPAPGTLEGLGGPDGSLQVHVCHSLARELEVLHDRLLGWFAATPGLLPADVLVVVPDLEAAAPLIDQVFGTAPSSLRIPYAVTGLPPAVANPLARALLGLLALAQGRMPLSQVLAVLQEPPVAQRFGLDAAGHEALATGLREADVRWGLDADHRAACGQPAQARGTLRDGLERLWLSHALPEGQALAWQGRLAASPVHPEPELLDSLHQFLARLATLHARLAVPLRPREWQALLEWTLAQFVADSGEWRGDRAELAADLQAQCAELLAAAADRPLAVQVLTAALGERLAGRASGGVATGAVTFAALPSLRPLPFRLVCALGLDDGVFPSPQRPLEFDLIASHPAQGDRTRGEEDRNLFLDLLLTARDGLHLSHSGRSARDDGERPPSVLLAELVDTVVAALCPQDATEEALQEMRARLVCRHPLQPFDEAYFLPGSQRVPRSHRVDFAAALRLRADLADAGAADYAAAPAAAPAVAMAGGPGAEAAGGDSEDDEDAGPDDAALAAAALVPFFGAPLPEPEGRLPLTLERLALFLWHPARALLRERLRLRLPEREAAWPDDEDFLPGWGAPQLLARHLLPPLLADPECDEAPLLAVACASTDYPPGAMGVLAQRAELQRLRQFAREVVAAGAAVPAPARTVQLALAEGACELTGSLPLLREGRQLGHDYVDANLRLELAIWLRHLWACAHAEAGAEPETTWILRDGTTRFRALACAQARQQLDGLAALHARGMREPVAFFPRSAAALLDKGMQEARNCWYGIPDHRKGEGDDVAWRTVLRGVADPLAGEFVQLAQSVLGPLEGARW